jgi:hypothetical protein
MSNQSAFAGESSERWISTPAQFGWASRTIWMSPVGADVSNVAKHRMRGWTEVCEGMMRVSWSLRDQAQGRSATAENKVDATSMRAARGSAAPAFVAVVAVF